MGNTYGSITQVHYVDTGLAFMKYFASVSSNCMSFPIIKSIPVNRIYRFGK